MNIHRKATGRGIRSVLTYWYRSHRYRPLLGYNLTPDQEREAAHEVIGAIHANQADQCASRSGQFDSPTFADFVPTYLQSLKVKRCADVGRNKAALDLHLTPHFGAKRLREIRFVDGLAYIENRRAEQAADGTIERECAVLMAVLNLAVECEVLDRNRLRKLPVPQYVKRERVAEGWELCKIMAAASTPVRHVVMIALQTGLREEKIIQIHEEWLVERGDRLWLVPAPGASRNKRVTKAVPLNRLALDALGGETPRIGGRYFSQWKDANSFKHRWLETCDRAGVHDLHFHDLRHTFATWLMQAGVDYIVIEKLLGHRLPGTGDLYVHDWDARLREAVTRLEAFTEAQLRAENGVQVPLEVPPFYLEQSPKPVTWRKMVPRDRIELSTPAFSGLCSAN